MTFIPDDGCWGHVLLQQCSQESDAVIEESNLVQSGMQQLQLHFNLYSGIIAVYKISFHIMSDAYWHGLLERKWLNSSWSILENVLGGLCVQFVCGQELINTIDSVITSPGGFEKWLSSQCSGALCPLTLQDTPKATTFPKNHTYVPHR